MQALIMAAGASSRFFPYNLKHKSLIKIAGETIIAHTVKAVKRAGITDIVIVVGSESEFKKELGNGKRFGVKIRFVVYKNAEGGGETILKASKLLTGDFFLLNANRVEFDELKDAIDRQRGTNQNVVLLERQDPDPKKHGILKVDGNKVLRLVEKPGSFAGLSKVGVAGVYFLTRDFLSVLKKEKKHHYSLESAIDTYAKAGHVRVAQASSQILGLKYPWDLLEIKNYLLSKITKKISKKANVAKSAIIEGPVVIEEGATINENATIKGPAYIGKNSYVGSNSLIRDNSSIEEASVVGGYMELKNSLIMTGSKTHSGHFEDSVMGEDSRLGALFTSANVKLDRKEINSTVHGEKVNTGLKSLGVMVGSGCRIGVRVSTMPGIIIGNNVNIGPSTTVMENLESDISYYTKFSSVVKKASKSKTR